MAAIGCSAVPAKYKLSFSIKYLSGLSFSERWPDLSNISGFNITGGTIGIKPSLVKISKAKFIKVNSSRAASFFRKPNLVPEILAALFTSIKSNFSAISK